MGYRARISPPDVSPVPIPTGADSSWAQAMWLGAEKSRRISCKVHTFGVMDLELWVDDDSVMRMTRINGANVPSKLRVGFDVLLERYNYSARAAIAGLAKSMHDHSQTSPVVRKEDYIVKTRLAGLRSLLWSATQMLADCIWRPDNATGPLVQTLKLKLPTQDQYMDDDGRTVTYEATECGLNWWIARRSESDTRPIRKRRPRQSCLRFRDSHHVEREALHFACLARGALVLGRPGTWCAWQKRMLVQRRYNADGQWRHVLVARSIGGTEGQHASITRILAREWCTVHEQGWTTLDQTLREEPWLAPGHVPDEIRAEIEAQDSRQFATHRVDARYMRWCMYGRHRWPPT